MRVLYQGDIGFLPALKRTFRAPYILASFVYVFYACIIIGIDSNPDGDLYLINVTYVVAGVVHMISAFLYMWVWCADGFPIIHYIQIPEYLNIIEAALYLGSASLYNYESLYVIDYVVDNVTMSFDPYVYYVGKIETTAAVVEMCAAFGWATTWFITFRRIPGRGLTLDDPDSWAAASIVICASIYVVYNAQVQLDPSLYGSYYLYVDADYLYLANALVYLLASLRDVGWFWFMPIAGKIPDEAMSSCCKPYETPHQHDDNVQLPPILEDDTNS